MRSTPSHRSAAALWLGVSLVAAQQAITGTWALLWPEEFFHRVPTVDVLPPYNEHLVRDVGAALWGTVPALAVAAWRRSAGVAALGLCGVLAFALPHAAFHLGHSSGAWLDGGVVASAALPVLLLVLAVRGARRGGTRPEAVRP